MQANKTKQTQQQQQQEALEEEGKEEHEEEEQGRMGMKDGMDAELHEKYHCF